MTTALLRLILLAMLSCGPLLFRDASTADARQPRSRFDSSSSTDSRVELLLLLLRGGGQISSTVKASSLFAALSAARPGRSTENKIDNQLNWNPRFECSAEWTASPLCCRQVETHLGSFHVLHFQYMIQCTLEPQP